MAVAVGVSCRTASPTPHVTPPAGAVVPIVQPGAPGQASRTVTAAQATDLSRIQFTAADVRFMQGMIGHHAQAVQMVELVDARSDDPDMKTLGLRIRVSQEDEIGMMIRWLEARGQAVPDPDPREHTQSAAMMPGMLTMDEMDRLAAAKGRAFDRLFLEGMIRHHGGALTMVKELFATRGAAQDGEIFAFASDVDADQRMEIGRMSRMLEERRK